MNLTLSLNVIHPPILWLNSHNQKFLKEINVKVDKPMVPRRMLSKKGGKAYGYN
jgi:hypothetical protein